MHKMIKDHVVNMRKIKMLMAILVFMCVSEGCGPKETMKPVETLDEATETIAVETTAIETTAIETTADITFNIDVTDYYGKEKQIINDYDLSLVSGSSVEEYKKDDVSYVQWDCDSCIISNYGNASLKLYGTSIGCNYSEFINNISACRSIVIDDIVEDNVFVYVRETVDGRSEVKGINIALKDHCIISWSVSNFFEGDPQQFICVDFLYDLPDGATETHYVNEGLTIPDSMNRALTEAEADALSKEELRWAINDIFARYGYIFTQPEAIDHYKNLCWYQGWESNQKIIILSFVGYDESNYKLLVDKKDRIELQDRTGSIAEEELVGDWCVDEEYTRVHSGKSLISMFGSEYKTFVPHMHFDEDGSFVGYIGFCGGEGTYKLLDEHTISVNYYDPNYGDTSVTYYIEYDNGTRIAEYYLTDGVPRDGVVYWVKK